MKQKFHLNRYNIPELNRKQDHYTTSGSKDNAVHNFALIISRKRYSEDKWKAKLNDIKREIFPYVNVVKENIVKKSRLRQIINEEIKNILIEDKEKLNPSINVILKNGKKAKLTYLIPAYRSQDKDKYLGIVDGKEKYITQDDIKENIIKENKYWLGDVPQKDDFGNKITNIFIDGVTYTGQWAIMAPIYWKSFGIGLGTGKGQMYKKQSNNKWLKIKG